MSVEFDRGSPGKFDSRTLYRETVDRWTGRNNVISTVSSCQGSRPTVDSQAGRGAGADGVTKPASCMN